MSKKDKKIVYQDSIWTVISILTPEASSSLCKNTSWAVQDPKWFRLYNINPDNPLYLILKHGKRHVLVNKNSKNLKDIYNNDLSYESLKELQPVLEKLGDNVLNYYKS